MSVRIDKQEDQAKCLYRTVSVRIDRQKGQAKGVETAGDHYPNKARTERPMRSPSRVKRTNSNDKEVVKGLGWRTPRVIIFSRNNIGESVLRFW